MARILAKIGRVEIESAHLHHEKRFRSAPPIKQNKSSTPKYLSRF
jgi:hypothetical protein